MVPSIIISRITIQNFKSLYIILTELSKLKKMTAKNVNFCILCYLHFQVPY